MESINANLIDEFLAFKIEFFQMASKSYEEYSRNLQRFVRFIETLGENLLTVREEHFVQYAQQYQSHRPDTLVTYMAALKSFYTWASDPTVAKVPKYPIPKMRLERSPAHPHVIPTAQQVFRMRPRFRKLREATAFELLLGSGLRIGELQQLRCTDFDFHVRVRDMELEQVSPYIGASCVLSINSGIRVKRRGMRTVFFSKLGIKLLLKHIESLGLNIDSAAPIMPYKHNSILRWLNKAGQGVIVSRTAEAEKPVTREPGFLDIDVAKMVGTDAYKKEILRAQEQERANRARFPMRKKALRIIASRPLLLHPHAMRHCFAVSQYYRNYYGNRFDLVTLRDMLGHASIDETEIYLKSQPTCANDVEWRRLWLGNGFDYARFN